MSSIKQQLEDLIADNNYVGIHVATPALAEIESLRQQLAEAQADRDAIKKEWEKAYEIGMLAKQQLASCQAALADTEALEIGTGERLATIEQQLSAALAACKQKDDALQNCEGMLDELRDYPITHDAIIEALAVQPNDAALKAWVCEPVGEVESIDTDEDGQPSAWVRLHVELKLGELLYKPKGLK